MKPLMLHRSLGLSEPDKAFDYLFETFGDAVRQWSFFVNWDKVFRNTREQEVYLNLWNYLIGKEDFESEFTSLVSRYPEMVLVIPSLIVRNGAHDRIFDVLADPERGPRGISRFDFSVPADTPDRVAQALQFVVNTGLVRIFRHDGIKNIVDYLLGVEAGIDSNGRKNRSGSAMEDLIEQLLAQLSAQMPGSRYLAQAHEEAINAQFGLDVSIGAGRRIYDFAFWTGAKLLLIEVNIYGGGGSKLKATAGEFVDLQDKLRSKDCTLVWITDGQGWKSTRGPLRDAFFKIDHIFNLHLLSRGALSEVAGLTDDSIRKASVAAETPEDSFRPS